MKKVTKSQVIAKVKKLNEEETLQVSLFPSNCGPSNTTWVQPFEIELHKKFDKVVTGKWDETFDSLLNRFENYNCNSELGKRVHFYINE